MNSPIETIKYEDICGDENKWQLMFTSEPDNKQDFKSPVGRANDQTEKQRMFCIMTSLHANAFCIADP